MADTLSYESLAERLNTELEQAKASTAAVNELKPGQHKVASMIGDAGQIPKGMSPTKTIARGVAAGESFAAADYQYGQKNVLEILGQMTALKSKKDSVEQNLRDYNLEFSKIQQEAKDTGFKAIDLGNGKIDYERLTDSEMSGNQLYNSNPMAWLYSLPGASEIIANMKLDQGKTKALAETVWKAYDGDLGKYIEANPDVVLSPDQQKNKEDIDSLFTNVRNAKSMLESDTPGKASELAGIGPESLLAPSFYYDITGNTDATDIRSYIAGISNETIMKLSGAAVSTQEAKRLAEQLPGKHRSEEYNLKRINDIYSSIVIGREMKKKALVNGYGTDNDGLLEAYRNFGAEAYESTGIEMPPWLIEEIKLNGSKDSEEDEYSQADAAIKAELAKRGK